MHPPVILPSVVLHVMTGEYAGANQCKVMGNKTVLSIFYLSIFTPNHNNFFEIIAKFQLN